VSVYCDPLQPWPASPKWPWGEVSHLFADTLEELHALASTIGLKRSWFQHKPGRLPHYDLTRGKHFQAIRAGAVPLEARQAVEFWRKKGWR